MQSFCLPRLISRLCLSSPSPPRSSLARAASARSSPFTFLPPSALFSSSFLPSPSPFCVPSHGLHTCPVLFRARQATRIRKRKVALQNRKKREERLRKFPPKIPAKVVLMLKAKGIWGKAKTLRPDEKDLFFPMDNVYLMRDFCHPRFVLCEAIEELRAHCEPPLLDRIDEFIHAKIEFNMKAGKADRYLDEFQKMIPIAHQFNNNAIEKSVCVFVSDPTMQQQALDAGAKLAGGEDLISDMVKGRIELADFDRFLCHDELGIHMRSVTGLLREKTPNKLDGTLGSDMLKMIRTFRTGISVEVKKVKKTLGIDDDPSYGFCEVPFGNFSMDVAQMSENLDLILGTLEENRPKRKSDSVGWITRVLINVPDGPEYAEFAVTHPLIQDPKWESNLRKQTGEEQDEGQGKKSRQRRKRHGGEEAAI